MDQRVQGLLGGPVRGKHCYNIQCGNTVTEIVLTDSPSSPSTPVVPVFPIGPYT